MTTWNLLVSEHAAQRMAQRNLDQEDITAVLRFGRVEYRTGAEFYFLGRRDLPKGTEQKFSRLVGTTIIVEDGWVVTVYRNHRAISDIKRKPKRPTSPKFRHMPAARATLSLRY
jgi:hypothetical protein